MLTIKATISTEQRLLYYPFSSTAELFAEADEIQKRRLLMENKQRHCCTKAVGQGG